MGGVGGITHHPGWYHISIPVFEIIVCEVSSVYYNENICFRFLIQSKFVIDAKII